MTDYNDNESDEAQEDNDNAGYEDDYSLDANSTEPTDANDPLRKKVTQDERIRRIRYAALRCASFHNLVLRFKTNSYAFQ